MNHFSIDKNTKSEKQKKTRISNWKFYGVIFDHIDEIDCVYHRYINTKKCDKCEKIFNNSIDKCLDHCHETGKFRAILCRNCNQNYFRSKYKTNKTGYKNIRLSYHKNSYVVEIQKDYKTLCKKMFSKRKYNLNDVVLFRNAVYNHFKLTHSLNEPIYNNYYSSDKIKDDIEKRLNLFINI